MLSLLLFVIILGIMIFVHELGHFIAARRQGIRVESFSLGFGPKLLSWKRGFTEYKICLFAFGGYVKMSGDNRADFNGQKYEFLALNPLGRAKIIFAGPFLNYLLGFICFWMVNLIGYPNLTTKVGELMSGYPAASSGLQKNDVIIEVEGKKVKYWNELREIISKNKASALKIAVTRDSIEVNLEVGLKQETITNIFGTKVLISRIGIKPAGEAVIVRHDVFEGLSMAVRQLWNMTVITCIALFKMATGSLALRDSVTGPLGMFYITSEALALGTSAILHLMAVLSASLAIFNLLPIPVLDGGHILFLAIEKVRGKPLSEKVDQIITQIAVALLIALALLVFLNDFSRFGLSEKIMNFFGARK